MGGTLTLPVAVFLNFCLHNCRPALAGCTYHLTGNRGHIISKMDVTSDHCEWDITTDPDRIILMNFDNRPFQRGTENCTGDVFSFHDGGSSSSRLVDTFCGIQGGLVAPYHLSTASTGHQLHVVFNRSPTALWSNDREFNLTFTTREIDNEPIFDDETFVPQIAEDFNVHTAANFVRLKLFDWFTYDDEGHFFAPYGYRTDRKTASGGDILEFYIGVDLNDFDFDLTPDMVYACEPTHGETVAFAQLFVNNNGREFPLENWPFIPFYTLFPRREEVAYVKYTYWNVKVGVENAVLNEMECVTNGQVFRTQIIVKACPIGRFGRFCAERCQCYNGASCHSFNGACRCAPGWTERNCNTAHPEVRISPSDDELTDLRYGQELQLTCTAYNIDVTDITWSFHAGDVSFDLLNVTNSKNSSVLHINSLLPEHEGHVTCEALTRDGAKYNYMVDIMISGCEDNLYGEFCDRVCNCSELETCNRTLGCVCQGEGCPGEAVMDFVLTDHSVQDYRIVIFQLLMTGTTVAMY